MSSSHYQVCHFPSFVLFLVGHIQSNPGHTGADAIEAGVGADGPARILHKGTGSGGLGRAKSKFGAVYVMPDCAARMASTIEYLSFIALIRITSEHYSINKICFLLRTVTNHQSIADENMALEFSD